jgi:Na+/melibiose symporter-like transporter
MFITKVLFALGGAVGLGLASGLGFDPTSSSPHSSASFALTVVMSWLPSALLAMAAIVILCIPMDERRHAIVRKRLQQRDTRLARALVAVSP